VLGQRCENARDTGAGLPKLLQVEGTPCWTLFIGADLISATPKAWFDRQMDVVDATGGDAAVLSRERQPPGFEWPISCDRSGCAPWKGGAFQWVQGPPGNRSSRKQPEQAWRWRNVWSLRVSVPRIGGSASVRAVTRVNA